MASLRDRRPDRASRFPLWVGGRSGLIRARRPFVTAAANLIDGFKVFPAESAIRYQGKREYSASAQQWETIRVPDHAITVRSCRLRWPVAFSPTTPGVARSTPWRTSPQTGACPWHGAFGSARPSRVRRTSGSNPARGPGAPRIHPHQLGGHQRQRRRTVLCRTNAKTMSEAMNAMATGGRKVAIMGGRTL